MYIIYTNSAEEYTVTHFNTHIWLRKEDGKEWDYPPSEDSKAVEDFAKVEIRLERWKGVEKKIPFYS